MVSATRVYKVKGDLCARLKNEIGDSCLILSPIIWSVTIFPILINREISDCLLFQLNKNVARC